MYGSRDVFWNDPQELQFELEKFHGNENELVLASKMGNHQIVNLLIPKIENINHQSRGSNRNSDLTTSAPDPP